MAEISIVVNRDAQDVLRQIAGIARKAGYQVAFVADGELSVRRGSPLGNLLAGPLLPICDFRIQAHGEAGGTAIELDINKSWWTGIVGLKQARGRAKELAQKVESELREGGAKILKSTGT
jgi:hypothetical protein